MTDRSNPFPGIPLVESPLFEDLVGTLPPDVATVARRLHDDGFAVIDFPEPDFNTLAEETIAQLAQEYDWAGWRAKKAGGGMGGMRIQDSPNALVRHIAGNPRIIELLSQLYGRPAFPFQTLNFPVGTEQPFHADAVHFSCVPERFMCGVWVALEDIGPEQGPLVYYPGSHKLPIYTYDQIGVAPDESRDQRAYQAAWERVVAARGLERRTFCAKRGQALIWAANLLHGGDAHTNPDKTRWTQVTHYYFENCVYYTPMHSDPFYGKVLLRTPVDLRTGQQVEPRYLNAPLPDRVQRFFSPVPVAVPANPPAPPPQERGWKARLGLRRDSPAGTLPSDFDAETYLRLNPDVRMAGVDASHHYLAHGRREGRAYRD
jgi:hypothetical protein